MSSRLDVEALGRLLDEGLRRGLVSHARLRRTVDRLGLAPGRSPKRLESLLARWVPGYDPGDSDLETHVWQVLVDAGLPPPVRQHRVRIGGRTYRIDLAYVEERIAIEVDGYDSHRSRSAFDDDRARANALVVAGWRILRFTSRSSGEDIVATVTPLFVHEPAL